MNNFAAAYNTYIRPGQAGILHIYGIYGISHRARMPYIEIVGRRHRRRRRIFVIGFLLVHREYRRIYLEMVHVCWSTLSAHRCMSPYMRVHLVVCIKKLTICMPFLSFSAG